MKDKPIYVTITKEVSCGHIVIDEPTSEISKEAIESVIKPTKAKTLLRSPMCECGCSCHINPPCSHCTDHIAYIGDVDEEERKRLVEVEGWGEE